LEWSGTLGGVVGGNGEGVEVWRGTGELVGTE